jgi:hypothetical protein
VYRDHVARFLITGRYDGVPASLTWEDGTFTTGDGPVDPLALGDIQALANAGAVVDIPGIFQGPAGAAEHLPALAAALAVFDTGATVQGDEPTPEQLPDGDVVT